MVLSRGIKKGISSVIRQKGKSQVFLKIEHFLAPDTHIYEKLALLYNPQCSG